MHLFSYTPTGTGLGHLIFPDYYSLVKRQKLTKPLSNPNPDSR